MSSKPQEIKGQEINLLNIKEIENSSVKIKFNLELISTEWTIRECLIIKKKDGSYFMTFPSREYEKDGVKKKYSFVTMPPERKSKLETLILEMLKPYYSLT